MHGRASRARAVSGQVWAATWAVSLSKAIVQPVAPGESRGTPEVGHGHLRLAGQVFELDLDLRGGGVPVGPGGGVALLVGHGLGVDEALVRDHLPVLAGEPHLHRPVRCVHRHVHPALAADPHVHLGGGDGGALGPVPLHDVLGFGPHLPDEVDRSIEGALDHHCVLKGVLVTHGCPLVAVVAGRGSRPCGRSGPPRRAGTARPSWPPRRGARRRERRAVTGPVAPASPARLAPRP